MHVTNGFESTVLTNMLDPARKLDLVAALSRRAYIIAYAVDDTTILEALAELRTVIARAELDLSKPTFVDPGFNPLDDDEL